MIFHNKKMKEHLGKARNSMVECPVKLNFFSLGGGYFFESEVNSSVRSVVDAYSRDEKADWAGFEYGVNKIHLTDVIDLPIDGLTEVGIQLVMKLSSNFKAEFPERDAIFWLSCNAEGDFPSVVIGFYVKRPDAAALLPEDNQLLDKFNEAILLVA